MLVHYLIKKAEDTFLVEIFFCSSSKRIHKPTRPKADLKEEVYDEPDPVSEEQIIYLLLPIYHKKKEKKKEITQFPCCNIKQLILLREVVITSVLDEEPPSVGVGGYARYHLSD